MKINVPVAFYFAISENLLRLLLQPILTSTKPDAAIAEELLESAVW